jgi:hypothetical protein
MIDRLLVAVICIWFGLAGLIPASPKPSLTPSQLQVKAKEKSISEMCDRKPKSKEAKDLCRRWKKQQEFL